MQRLLTRAELDRSRVHHELEHHGGVDPHKEHRPAEWDAKRIAVKRVEGGETAVAAHKKHAKRHDVGAEEAARERRVCCIANDRKGSCHGRFVYKPARQHRRQRRGVRSA